MWKDTLSLGTCVWISYLNQAYLIVSAASTKLSLPVTPERPESQWISAADWHGAGFREEADKCLGVVCVCVWGSWG